MSISAIKTKTNINIFFACNDRLNKTTLGKLIEIEKLIFFHNFRWFATKEAGIENLFCLKKNISFIRASSKLFDFSRYKDFLTYCKEDDLVIMFNDTLGTGRKFGFGLKCYILISIILLRFRIIDIAAPLDRDEIGSWISPYLVIGRASILQQLNWTGLQSAKKKITEKEKFKIENWLDTKWRSRKIVTEKQKNTKMSILILERNLLQSAHKKLRIFPFSKRNPFRILNSLHKED